MQTVKLELMEKPKTRKKTEYDKMLNHIKLVVALHKHETINREHFLNKGFVIK